MASASLPGHRITLTDVIPKVSDHDFAFSELDEFCQMSPAAADVLQHLRRNVLPESVGLDFKDQLQLFRDKRHVGKLLKLFKPAGASPRVRASALSKEDRRTRGRPESNWRTEGGNLMLYH